MFKKIAAKLKDLVPNATPVKISGLPATQTIDPKVAVVPVVSNGVTCKINVADMVGCVESPSVPTLYACTDADINLPDDTYQQIPLNYVFDNTVKGLAWDANNSRFYNSNSYDIDLIVNLLGIFKGSCAGTKTVVIWIYDQNENLVFYSGESGYLSASEVGRNDTVSASTPVRIPAGCSMRLYAMSTADVKGSTDTLLGGSSNGLPKSYLIAKQLQYASTTPSNDMKPGLPVPTWGDVTDTSASLQFAEVAGSKPITYWAELTPTGGSAFQQELDVVYASSTVFAKIMGLKPGQEYSASIYGTNRIGTGTRTAIHTFKTANSVTPDAPILNAVYPAKTSILLDYTYPQAARLHLEPKYYNAYASDGTKTTKAEVYDPDLDMVIAGLTEGTKYDCWVTAVSAEGNEGPKSNIMSTTCKSVIPAPKLLTAVAGDGKVDLTWTPVTPGGNYTVDHYSFSAKDISNPDEPNIEGHIVGTTSGTIALANNTTWEISICAVCNPGLIPGDFSNSIQATPEQPTVPYRPVITTCYVQPSGQIVVEWVKGVNGSNRNSSAMEVTSWQLNVLTADGKGTSQILDIKDPLVTKYLTDKVTIGWWEVIVYAINDQGRSDGSKPISVQYNPTKDDPILGGTRYDDGTYKYAMFNSGATTGYEAVRTDAGKDVTFEVLLCGAGGSGKGVTLAGGKGGDAGGGQMVIGTLPATANTTSIMISVPKGGASSGAAVDNTTVTETTTTLVAIAGKSASDKNNADGYPKQPVPDGWKLLPEFTWLHPVTDYVGGVASSGEQNYPNATNIGEGGAGTKTNSPGRGGDSFVAIRWKK